jgi:tellurite resistance protein TehA-like permease
MSQKYTLLTFKGSCMNFLLELKYFVLSHPVTSKQLHKIIQIHMRHPVEISWNQEPSLFYSTGCLNMLCNTSNQHFFRLKWYSKQKLFIFGILSREDLCLIHSFNFLFCTQPLQPQIFRVSKFKFFEAIQPQIWSYEIDKKL